MVNVVWRHPTQGLVMTSCPDRPGSRLCQDMKRQEEKKASRELGRKVPVWIESQREGHPEFGPFLTGWIFGTMTSLLLSLAIKKE